MELTDLSDRLITLRDPATGNTNFEALRLLNEDLAPAGLMATYIRTEQWGGRFVIISTRPVFDRKQADKNARAALPYWPD